MESFGELLEKLIRRRGWTKKAAARAFGLRSGQAVGQWCAGKTPPTRVSIDVIINALKAPLIKDEDLLKLRALYRALSIPVADAAYHPDTFPTPSKPLEASGSKSRRPKNLPFISLGNLFIGRNHLIGELQSQLVSANDQQGRNVNIRCVHGLGGIGKTRLVVEYALENEDSYSALLFVFASAPGVLDKNLASLADTFILNLPEKNDFDDDVKINAVFDWLEDHPGWLMIFDNVDDRVASAAVEKILTKLRGGTVLIVGRMSNFSSTFRRMELTALEEKASIEFLLARTQGYRQVTSKDSAIVRQLAGELAGLPLALEQASAYICVERISFGRYLTLWKKECGALLDWFDRSVINYFDYHDGLATTWLTSVTRVSASSRRLLGRMAYLGPNPIHEDALDVTGLENEIDFNMRRAITELYAYSLVSKVTIDHIDQDIGGLYVHPLVQQFARRTFENASQLHEEALIWAIGIIKHRGNAYRTIGKNAIAILANETDRKQIRSLELKMVLSLDIRKSQEIIEIIESSFSLKNEMEYLGSRSSSTAAVYRNYVRQLYQANRPKEAESVLRKIIAIDLHNHIHGDARLSVSYSELAKWLKSEGRTSEAQQYYEKARAIHDEGVATARAAKQ